MRAGTSAHEIPAAAEAEELVVSTATREGDSERTAPAGRGSSEGPRECEARVARAGEREGLPCTGADAVGRWPTAAHKCASSRRVPVRPGAPTPSSSRSGCADYCSTVARC